MGGYDVRELIDGVLARKPRSIARAMSLAEAKEGLHRDFFAELYGHGGRAHVIGITGVPGSGKSTLVRALAQAIRASGRTVGIVAVDPSSPFSGGAVLGDRVRMGDLAGDEGVFIRSMATRGALGGLAHGCFETVDVLDAAGFDVVLVETVGVGQDEVDIASAAHTVLVVSAPGLGDDIQAIKAGILEIADIHVVSKSDRADAQRTVSDLKTTLSMGLKGRPRHGWEVPVIATSAEQGSGVDALLAAIDGHLDHLRSSDEWAVRARDIAEMRVTKAAEGIVRARIARARQAGVLAALDDVAGRTLDPFTAATAIIGDDPAA